MSLRPAPILAAAALVAAGLGLADHVTAAPLDAAKVKRGGYLVGIMDCVSCHTPFKMGAKGPEPDMARYLSGHPQALVMPAAPDLGQGPWLWTGAATNTAFAGPWGVSFAANLTSDPRTGLGQWTEATFVQAMRTGRHEGQGRPLLPPMPFPAIAQATDEDLGAIFAYLQTVPAISNKVPQAIEPAEHP